MRPYFVIKISDNFGYLIEKSYIFGFLAPLEHATDRRLGLNYGVETEGAENPSEEN